MPSTKLGKLVQLLVQRTDEQKITWEKTVDEEIFQVAFSDYILQLGFRPSNDPDQIDYYIRILNEDNKTVEEATDIDLQPEFGGAQASYKTMDTLYKQVRRQAMGIDKALDSILSELEDRN